MVSNIVVCLERISGGVVHENATTYQKGDMFCVITVDGVVYRYPIAHIYFVKETPK